MSLENGIPRLLSFDTRTPRVSPCRTLLWDIMLLELVNLGKIPDKPVGLPDCTTPGMSGGNGNISTAILRCSLMTCSLPAVGEARSKAMPTFTRSRVFPQDQDFPGHPIEKSRRLRRRDEHFTRLI